MEKFCKKCGFSKDIESGFYPNKRRKDGHDSACKECLLKYAKNYYQIKHKFNLKYKKQRCNFAKKRYRKKRLELLQQGKLRNYHARLRCLDAYGGKCSFCPETMSEFLAIDHIDGGGNQHRKKLKTNRIYLWLEKNGYPKDGYRILCHNCNVSLAMYGYSPHQIINKTIQSPNYKNPTKL